MTYQTDSNAASCGVGPPSQTSCGSDACVPLLSSACEVSMPCKCPLASVPMPCPALPLPLFPCPPPATVPTPCPCQCSPMPCPCQCSHALPCPCQWSHALPCPCQCSHALFSCAASAPFASGADTTLMTNRFVYGVAAMLQDPDIFGQAHQMKRADLRIPPHTSALFIDCKDPVHFLVSLSGGPLPSTPTPAYAVRCASPHFNLTCNTFNTAPARRSHIQQLYAAQEFWVFTKVQSQYICHHMLSDYRCRIKVLCISDEPDKVG